MKVFLYCCETSTVPEHPQHDLVEKVNAYICVKSPDESSAMQLCADYLLEYGLYPEQLKSGDPLTERHLSRLDGPLLTAYKTALSHGVGATFEMFLRPGLPEVYASMSLEKPPTK